MRLRPCTPGDSCGTWRVYLCCAAACGTGKMGKESGWGPWALPSCLCDLNGKAPSWVSAFQILFPLEGNANCLFFLMFLFQGKEWTGDVQTEQNRGSETGSVLTAASPVGSSSWTWDHDLSQSQMLNQLNHPGVLVLFFFMNNTINANKTSSKSDNLILAIVFKYILLFFPLLVLELKFGRRQRYFTP